MRGKRDECCGLAFLASREGAGELVLRTPRDLGFVCSLGDGFGASTLAVF